MKPSLFFQLTKVDAQKREVWGRATQEVPDKSGEIFDYDSSKPLFEAWSGEISKATDGKSLGNIRAMHGDVAAGKVISIDFNDAEKAIDIGAKIVDDQEWTKVEEGVYTGFSIGGSYEKRWTDPQNASLKRFTAKPAEISIVDNPCVPTAHFTMVKADGVSEERSFKAPAAADGGAAGAAAGTGAEVAGSADASKAAGAEGAAAKSAPAAPALKKSMYDVSALCDALSTIRYLAMSAESEKNWEGDDSPVPAQLRSWLADGAAILKAMADEEVAEMLASVQPPEEVEVLALSVKSGELGKRLLKAGARHSKSDQELVQKVHDHAVGLGASCGAEKSDDAGALRKRAGEALTDLGKAIAAATGAQPTTTAAEPAEIEALAKHALSLATERDDLKKKVEQLEAQAAPAKGVTKVVPVEKKDDSKPADAAESDPFAGVDINDPDAVAKAAMKAVHARGAKVVNKS